MYIQTIDILLNKTDNGAYYLVLKVSYVNGHSKNKWAHLLIRDACLILV
jgi:hypothetical protein